MRAGKGSQEEDEYEEEEFGSSKKQGTSSAPNTNKGTFLIFIEKKTMFVWLYFIPTLLLDPINKTGPKRWGGPKCEGKFK